MIVFPVENLHQLAGIEIKSDSFLNLFLNKGCKNSFRKKSLLIIREQENVLYIKEVKKHSTRA